MHLSEHAMRNKELYMQCTQLVPSPLLPLTGTLENLIHLASVDTKSLHLSVSFCVSPLLSSSNHCKNSQVSPIPCIHIARRPNQNYQF